jgi:hypothetical protein
MSPNGVRTTTAGWLGQELSNPKPSRDGANVSAIHPR